LKSKANQFVKIRKTWIFNFSIILHLSSSKHQAHCPLSATLESSPSHNRRIMKTMFHHQHLIWTWACILSLTTAPTNPFKSILDISRVWLSLMSSGGALKWLIAYGCNIMKWFFRWRKLLIMLDLSYKQGYHGWQITHIYINFLPCQSGTIISLIIVLWWYWGHAKVLSTGNELILSGVCSILEMSKSHLW
jgi:hypothetical protein